MRDLRKRIAENEAAREADRQATEPSKKRERKPSVATHPAFVPMLAVWGLALGAGSILVLPARMVADLAPATALSGLGGLSVLTLAVTTGLIVGGLAGIAAVGFKRAQARSAPTGDFVSVAARRFVPIDPASELGSESLDSPIEEEPLASEAEADEKPRGPTLGELAENGYELPVKADGNRPLFTRKDYSAALEQTCEGAAETGDDRIEEQASDDARVPLELDLAEFATLPGRNAVWVEEGAGEAVEAKPIDEPKPDAEAEAEPHAERRQDRGHARESGMRLSALEKLRQTPTDDLSLIQMVERFAAALHERQAADHADPSPRRDAALAEALKALTVLSETGLEIEAQLGQVQTAANGNAEVEALRDTTRELRDALAKLQTLRGAA